MAIKDIFKISRKTFFDPVGWFGSDTKINAKIIWALTKDLFSSAETTRSETFEQAMNRFQLTDADLKKRARNFFIFSLLFLACGLVSAVYGLYLLSHNHTFAGLLLAIATTALFLAQAFRYHFWFFQIQHRKLGCTFQEWWQGKPKSQTKKGSKL